MESKKWNHLLQRKDDLSMSKLTQTAMAVRKFNRVYLPYFRLLSQKYLNTEYTVTEARVLYEIYEQRQISAKDVANHLCIDKGYLSRILKKFEHQGFIQREVSDDDSRLSHIYMTRHGKEITEYLMKASTQQVEEALAQMSDRELSAMEFHMSEILKMIGGNANGNR